MEEESQSTSYELDSERFTILDTLVEESGVTPMLHRFFVSPIIEEIP